MTHLVSGMSPAGSVAISFHRNDNDRRPPREIVTGKLLGDPAGTWEERLAASDMRLAKLIKPRMAKDSMISDYILIPMLRAIADGVRTQNALADKLDVAVSTIAGRVSQALRREFIEARRDRLPGSGSYAIYFISDSGRDFLERHAEAIVKTPRDFTRADGPKLKKRHIPVSFLRNAILDAIADGNWHSAAQIAEKIDRDSNAVSSAARRAVDHGHIERDDTAGIGSKALYRITGAGRYYRETGIA